MKKVFKGLERWKQIDKRNQIIVKYQPFINLATDPIQNCDIE